LLSVLLTFVRRASLCSNATVVVDRRCFSRVGAHDGPCQERVFPLPSHTCNRGRI
jgi:hypothetical protein